MLGFVSKFSSLPFAPVERKTFDNLAQCEHLLFDPSIKQAFLLPLFHFLQKSKLRVYLPLGELPADPSLDDNTSGAYDRTISKEVCPAHLAPPSFIQNAGKSAYKYWVICTEGFETIEAMRKQKKEDGSPLYSEGDLQRLSDRYGKTWWKVPKQEYEDLVSRMKTVARAHFAVSSKGLDTHLFLRSIHKKAIDDKFSKDEITLLIPETVPVISGSMAD